MHIIQTNCLVLLIIIYYNFCFWYLCPIEVHLYRAAADEEADVIKFVGDVSQIFGAFVVPSLWLPLSVGHLGLSVSAADQKKVIIYFFLYHNYFILLMCITDDVLPSYSNHFDLNCVSSATWA